MVDKGLSVLGVARKSSDAVQDDPYTSLVFMGCVGFLDPPRKGVKDVIRELHQAGVRVVMVTGDHPGTASAIARTLDLCSKTTTSALSPWLWNRAIWIIIVGYGALIAGIVLSGFWISLVRMSLPAERAVTISFLILAFARTWHAFNMHDFGSTPFCNDVTRNPFVWGAVTLSVALLLLAVYFHPLATVLSMVAPTSGEWFLILGMSLIPLVVVQILKQFAFLDPFRKETILKEK